MTPVDIENELAELLAALDAVNDLVAQWEAQPLAPPGRDGASPAGPAPGLGLEPGPVAARSRVGVSGEGPDAAEERSVLGASAALARARAREVREELAAVRERTRQMAERAREAIGMSPAPAAGAGGLAGDLAGYLAGDLAVAAVARTALALRAVQLGEARDAEQAMTRIVAGALRVTTRARWGAICVQGPARGGRRGEVGVHAASDPAVERLEALQAGEGEGPSVQALTGAKPGPGTVYEPDVLGQRRWPRFARLAGELGVRSALAIGLPVSFPGAVLTLYSPHPDAFDRRARAMLEVFAEHAATALADARRAGRLNHAVESRDVIGQAKGMLMLRHDVDAERAFAMLVAASQHSNLKLVDVARWTIENAASL